MSLGCTLLPVSMYQLKPLGLVRYLCIAEIAVYGHQQNDRTEKWQITSIFSRTVVSIIHVVLQPIPVCYLVNRWWWKKSPGMVETW